MSHGVLEVSGLPATAISVGASAFVYTNREGRPVNVLVSGGTVTTIELSRNSGASWTLAGLLAGQFYLAPADQMRVTYAVAPTRTMIPF